MDICRECSKEFTPKTKQKQFYCTDACGAAFRKRKYGKSPDELRFEARRYNAKKRGIPFTLTFSECQSLKDQSCYYCGEPMNGISIDRKNCMGGYEADNVVQSCLICNQMKLVSPVYNFIEQCKKIADNHSK